ncbi:MAG: TonB-dependent receptor [Opitutae bacterium]|nr:TonB-dependent receptor [Opitutae bacterium]
MLGIRTWLGLALASFASAQSIETLPPFGVTAARSSRAETESAAFTREFSSDELANAPALDDALRTDPAFSLFRRTGSLAAHPTAQGVSLRGIGPSGASRSLVLLDGVPLNDPFGGWVQWTQIPSLSLASAEIARGGGSGTWGNAALGGTIALVSAPVARADGALRLEAAQRDTWLAEFSTGAASARAALRVDARAFTTDGYHPLAPADRGAIDTPLSGEHAAVQLRSQGSLGCVEATLTLRHFEDDRVNGTVGQRNATRQNFAALALRGSAPTRDWQLTLYGQGQTLRSTFTAASLDRTTETPANDQFDVPATAAGAAFTVEWREAGQRTTAGADLRRVRGETREDFLFSNGAFTRRRFAGGSQTLGGIFVAHDRRLVDAWHGSLSLRADGWQLADGHRREINRITGTSTRTDIFPDRSGATWSASAGLVWSPAERWRARASAYRAFRLPTLNELYRPFRVGNVNTEANPALRPESLLGAEIGGDYRAGAFTASVTGFANRLDDAVGNVTLAATPTLVSRERRNLDRIDNRGAEVRVTWSANARLSLDAAWLWSDSEIARAASQPSLVGKRLAQAPRHVATAGAQLALARGWTLRAQGRWTARQFEDDENRLTLGAAGTLDLFLSGRIAEHTMLTLALDNVTDTSVPVARAANGQTSYAAPRTWRIGLRVGW